MKLIIVMHYFKGRKILIIKHACVMCILKNRRRYLQEDEGLPKDHPNVSHNTIVTDKLADARKWRQQRLTEVGQPQVSLRCHQHHPFLRAVHRQLAGGKHPQPPSHWVQVHKGLGKRTSSDPVAAVGHHHRRRGRRRVQGCTRGGLGNHRGRRGSWCRVASAVMAPQALPCSAVLKISSSPITIWPVTHNCMLY